MFGGLAGGLYVVVGATIGATLVFLAARTVLGNGLRQRAGLWFERMQDGFRDNAFSYLLTLRLVPLFPFFIINLIPAFLNITTQTYITTTLIKIILGLLTPSEGTVRVLGRNPKKAALDVGYVPQHLDFDSKFPATAQDIALLGRIGCRPFALRFNQEDKKAVDEALKLVGLTEQKNEMFANLSGGQRQRVLIARAICSNPKMLLMDEPTASIDSRAESDFSDILEQLNEKMTIAVATHDIAFVDRFINRVICVNRKVVVHPTSDLTGKAIHDLYESNKRIVEHSCLEPSPHDHSSCAK